MYEYQQEVLNVYHVVFVFINLAVLYSEFSVRATDRRMLLSWILYHKTIYAWMTDGADF
jgi:hypothetical protein